MAESKQYRYLELYTAEHLARDKFSKIERLIAQVSTALSSTPFTFSFANGEADNTDRGTGAISVDAKAWPTAVQIQEALTAWLTAREAYQRLWGQMMPHERMGLTAPIGYEDSPVGLMRPTRPV